MNTSTDSKNAFCWTIFGMCLKNTFLNSIRVSIFKKIENPSSIDDYRDIPVLVGRDWTLAHRILYGYANIIKSVEVTHNHPKNAERFWQNILFASPHPISAFAYEQVSLARCSVKRFIKFHTRTRINVWAEIWNGRDIRHCKDKRR